MDFKFFSEILKYTGLECICSMAKSIYCSCRVQFPTPSDCTQQPITPALGHLTITISFVFRENFSYMQMLSCAYTPK